MPKVLERFACIRPSHHEPVQAQEKARSRALRSRHNWTSVANGHTFATLMLFGRVHQVKTKLGSARDKSWLCCTAGRGWLPFPRAKIAAVVVARGSVLAYELTADGATHPARD